MNIYTNNKAINNQTEMSTKIKSTKVGGIGTSIFHLFIYITLLTFVSVAATAQCDNVSLACNNSINISTNDACIAEICADLVLENNVAGFTMDDFSLELQDAVGNPLAGTSAVGNCEQVGDAHVGMQIKALVTLDQCGISCWGYINIEDKVGPRFLDCVGNAEFGLGERDITCEDFVLGVGLTTPSIASSCTAVTLTHEDENTGVQCSGPYSGSITRTWYATDGAGNTSECKERFNILKFNVNNVVFPEDTVHYLDAVCNYPDTSPEALGLPLGVQCPNIMYTHTDIQTETCGGQQKFLRDWFVIDWCTGESVTDGQVVKIIDVLPPVTSCPQDTMYYTAIGSTCSARVVLDPFAVQDSTSAPAFVEDCSGPMDLVVEFLPAIPGTNQPVEGPYIPVAMGSDSLFTIPQLVEQAVWVRYCFTDACGNGNQINDEQGGGTAVSDFVNCCFFEVQVEDNLPPTAICEGFTKISLSPEGHTEVFASTFDDHSHDACGSVVGFEARRIASHQCGGTTAFSDKVTFCCSDLGDTIDVVLKVLDDDGNSSLCTSRVCVADPTEPILSCPDDVTVDCEDDYTDTDLIGNATGVDGCTVTFSIGSDDFDLTDYDASCKVGDIIRTINITSNAGNVIRTCEQNIHVDASGGSATLEPGDFTAPPAATVDVCDVFSIHPDILGYPQTDKEFGCINLGISWEDSNPVTSDQPNVCHTIVRSWLVVDWCRYNTSSPGDHSLSFTQTITVMNSGVPLLSCPDMQMVSTTDPTCRAEIDLDVVVTDACGVASEVTWEIDADSDGNVDLTGTGDSASGVYPVGEHTITFSANNECQGEKNSCTFPFIIKGDRPPLPICLSSITWTLSENGNALVWASDFDLKSEGGCDGTDSLTFSFVAPTDATYPETSREFTCADIPNGVAETITLSMFIVDEAGSFESCTVMLVLQDTNNACTDTGNRSIIAGNIMTETALAVNDVMVHLDKMTNNETEMSMTDPNGGYAFNNVEFYEDYMVQPEYNENPLNGVSTLDLVQIQRHILGLDLLDSPYKLLAADVNDDSRINGLDLIELQKLILGVTTQFPQNDSWIFVSDNYEFADVTAPWGYTNNISIDELLVSELDADFTAVKVGDVNNSAAMAQGKLDTRSNSTFYLSGVDLSYAEGELINVPFTVEQAANIDGFQFTFEFDHEKLLFQGIDGAAVDMDDNNFALLNNHNGVLTFSVALQESAELSKGDILFNAYFETKAAVELSDVISINSSVLDSEIYTGDNEINTLEYVFRSVGYADGQVVELFQNQPNPFTDYTSIAFYVPNSQEVSLTVYQAEGKVLWNETRTFEKGINEFIISSADLGSEGILMYRLDTGASSHTKKMILVR